MYPWNHRCVMAAGLLALVGIVGCAQQETSERSQGPDPMEMTPEAYAEYLVFESGSFRLDQPVQEGGDARQRMEQDEIQRLCSETRNRPPADVAARIVRMARESMRYPEDGIQLGDWRKGAELARSGYGYRVGHRNDDPDRAVGGNCYACHQMDPDELGYGNLGPSLTNYGELRGQGESVRRFVYEMIYNAHAYFPCTDMPRFGVNDFLDEESISHIMAYLLDPESPVNPGIEPREGERRGL